MVVKVLIFIVCGIFIYVVFEIFEEIGYGFKVDMWVVGVIIYIMFCGFLLFCSVKKDQDELFDLIMDGDYEFFLFYWDNVFSEVKDLIFKFFVVNYNECYSVEEVLVY